HPVTEFVTGIDLVQWQLRIAAGEKLPFKQEDVAPKGWAIECRITSEDPANGFLPSTGTIEYFHVPAGPGVRWDGGIEAGSEIGLFYDPMVGKLIVHAPTREAAIERMRRALLELTVTGIETSRDFHLRLLENAQFRKGDIDIQWLERHLQELTEAPIPADVERVAIIAAALVAERQRVAPQRATATSAAAADSPWLRAARTEGLR